MGDINRWDMKALRYVIASCEDGLGATTRGLAGHLGISLRGAQLVIERLVRQGLVQHAPRKHRSTHPTDAGRQACGRPTQRTYVQLPSRCDLCGAVNFTGFCPYCR